MRGFSGARLNFHLLGFLWTRRIWITGARRGCSLFNCRRNPPVQRTRRYLENMVPVERIELPTFGLQNRCSTAELNRQTSFNHQSMPESAGIGCRHRRRWWGRPAVKYQSCPGRATGTKAGIGEGFRAHFALFGSWDWRQLYELAATVPSGSGMLTRRASVCATGVHSGPSGQTISTRQPGPEKIVNLKPCNLTIAATRLRPRPTP